MIDRRQFLTTAVAAPLVSAPALAQPHDPLPELWERWKHAKAMGDASTGDALDIWGERLHKIECQICQTKAVTVQGLQAQAKWLHQEMKDDVPLGADLEPVIDNFFGALGELVT